MCNLFCALFVCCCFFLHIQKECLDMTRCKKGCCLTACMTRHDPIHLILHIELFHLDGMWYFTTSSVTQIPSVFPGSHQNVGSYHMLIKKSLTIKILFKQKRSVDTSTSKYVDCSKLISIIKTLLQSCR